MFRRGALFRESVDALSLVKARPVNDGFLREGRLLRALIATLRRPEPRVVVHLVHSPMPPAPTAPSPISYGPEPVSRSLMALTGRINQYPR